MNCREIKTLSNAYADRELDLVRSTECERHLNGCRSCAQELENIRAMSSALKSSTFYFRAPANLRRQILASTRSRNGTAHLPKAHAAAREPWTQWLRWLIPVATAAAVFLLVTLVSSSDNRLTEEVISSHLRSLMANHLTDVASTDHHTVKPWFAGKVDFAPPVIDLSDHGFPLVGGRLDYFQGRSVAAEVYQRNKHIINLFLWPAKKSGDTSRRFKSDKGYNVMSWQAAGMNYAAVSDLNPAELREFTELLKVVRQGTNAGSD